MQISKTKGFPHFRFTQFLFCFIFPLCNFINHISCILRPAKLTILGPAVYFYPARGNLKPAQSRSQCRALLCSFIFHIIFHSFQLKFLQIQAAELTFRLRSFNSSWIQRHPLDILNRNVINKQRAYLFNRYVLYLPRLKMYFLLHCYIKWCLC